MRRVLAAFLILTGLALPAVVRADDASIPQVKVRVGEHENFSRIVFDWPTAVPYIASLDKGTLTLDFKAAGAPDLSAFTSDPPSGIKLDAVTPGADELKIAFTISKPAKLRQFRDGPRVVVDILFDENPAPTAKNIRAAPPPKPVETAKTSPIPIKPLNPEITKDLPKLKVTVGPGDDGIRMTFPWTDSAAAAVVQRAGQLWVVFDLPSEVDLSDIAKKLGDRFSAVEQIADDRATILHFTARQMQYPVVRRNDDVWTIDLDNVANPPATPIEAREQMTDDNEARLFMPVKDPGLKIDLTDPVVGDHLTVVPVFGSGFGFDQPRQYAEFRLLGTPQGIAIEPRADWLKIQRESNGIAITGARALARSTNTPGDKKSVADRPAVDAPTRLIDFDAWASGSDDAYWDNLDKLLYDLSLAPSDARNAARWALAKFYLAHHMAPDALGVLGLMAQSDVRLEEDPQFRAVRGVAKIFMGRYADALRDLSFPRLDAEPDAALWRAVAESELGKNEAALDHYHQGLDVITDYSEVDRARFQLAAAKAAMGTGDVDTMNTETSVLDGMKLPVSMEAQTKYLEGRMYELQNDSTSALDAYGKAIALGYRPVSAKAEFRQIEVEAKQGTIKPKEEIDKLDALRFKWRGGPLEFDVLHRLGQRYVDGGDYRHGLEILRQAVTYFPDSDATRAITQEMNQVFRKLFLDGGADKMAPVAALALYYDFQELTPIGSDGDEMVRKLSDRLVKVDLLDRAEELLEHQVNYRLKGAAQAQVAARLARVYLLDRKPEKAVKIIEDTRQVLLPPDIGHMRLLLEARGLADEKKYDEAEGTLDGITGRDADLVRADIYWDAQQWNKVASISDAILGDRWQTGGTLEPIERQTVMRWAVALALQNDQHGLADIQKKYGKLMAATPAANAFAVVTTTVDPTGINLRDLAGQIASVNTIEKLFDDYDDKSAPAS